MSGTETTELGYKAYVFDGESRLLAVRRSDAEDHGRGVWEVPGGQLDYGESPSGSVKREVGEETGLEVEILEPFNTWFFEKDADTNIVGVDFLARRVAEEVTLSGEHDDHRWVDRDSSEGIEFYGSIGRSAQKVFQLYEDRYD